MREIRLTIDYARGERFAAELPAGKYTVGSGDDVEIQVVGEGIAEQHGVLVIEHGRLSVESLGNALGVNGTLIEKTLAVEYPLSRLLLIFQKVCDAMTFARRRGFCIEI
jgi:hypothetical protein